MKNTGILQGFKPEDYDMLLDCEKMSPEDVFERFNGVVSSVEAETNFAASFNVEKYGKPSFSQIRSLELVRDYDDFINSPKFKLGVYYVGKLEMENFWRVIGQKNKYSIVNKAKTYGGSSIYEIKYGLQVLGFLKNNMTYDGQNSHFLYSNECIKVGDDEFCKKEVVKPLFIEKRKYPTFILKNGQPYGRWSKIIAKLAANKGTAINAWSILESKDSMFFYAELKRHNVFSKEDKALLKAIRKTGKGMTFDSYKETVECRISELKDLITEYEENKHTETSVFDYFDALEELAELEAKLVEFGEEDNSMSSDSELEDYDNWNYYLGNGY